MKLKGIVEVLYEVFGTHNQHHVRVTDEDGNECDLYDLKRAAIDDDRYYVLGRNKRNVRVIRVREDDGGAGPVLWTVKGPISPAPIRRRRDEQPSL
jgi:hypothetical protein